MAFSLFSTKNRIINLMLNDHSIRFLELKQANPPVALRWGERFLTPGIITDGKIVNLDALSSILEECIDEWKIQKRSIRFIVPDQLVIIRKINVPVDIQDDELKGYLYLELGSTIHLPFEEPVFDIYPLGKNGKTRELLLFAAPEEHVMGYEDLFSRQKLHSVAADISPLALYRLYHQIHQPTEHEVLFSVQFDLTSVNLSIFEGTVPLVMRTFAMAFNVDQWEVKRDLRGLIACKYLGDVDELVLQFEDIFKEMNKLIDYYRYTLNNEIHDISKILLLGDHPMLQAVEAEINERFEVPVEKITFNPEFTDKKDTVPDHLLVPLGLALKGVV
ncbi:type IV pilus biogenesis protein PilM [Bacillus sp. FJAT-29814]|uniref:type IV pilus biogenesis protein PilM n=1 Tax=Bacillus sp. FJAT-29814 TaxID=1729688 RepID=UPI0008340CA9|nr:pilus assembly protein PilM [Bacillus sp. FJAT-29814]